MNIKKKGWVRVDSERAGVLAEQCEPPGRQDQVCEVRGQGERGPGDTGREGLVHSQTLPLKVTPLISFAMPLFYFFGKINFLLN